MKNILFKIRAFIVKRFSKETRVKITKYLLPFIAFWYRGDLVKLAILYATDKYGSHWYAPHYEKHFRSYKNKKIQILEIGIGGGDDPIKGGHSLRMWKRFFSRAKVFGIDLYNKKPHEEYRIKTFQGDQNDPVFLKDVAHNIGDIDIIIDDGSHINEHIITSFETLFPLLKDGGIYVIEDLQTSYWPEYGGDSNNIKNPTTAMNYLKELVNGINYQEFMRKEYEPSYFDKNILSIHFYHNLVFIYKGENNEGSNVSQKRLQVD